MNMSTPNHIFGHRNIIFDTSKTVATFGIIDWKPLPGLKWMQLNWHWSIYLSFIYICVIFTIRRHMKHRDAFKLRSYLCLWNIFLCIFSIFGSYFMIPEMLNMLNTSFYHSVCYSSIDERAQYWMWLFALSKVAEFGDTFFIVLRKQKLIFLHYIHHILTLIFTWYSVSQNISLGRWYVTMNYVVHSVMYAYYAARAVKWNVSRFIAMIITSLQIIQMISGFYVSFYAFKSKLFGVYCEISMKSASFGFGVYLVFTYLFARFFIISYIKNQKKISDENIQNMKNIEKCHFLDENFENLRKIENISTNICHTKSNIHDTFKRRSHMRHGSVHYYDHREDGMCEDGEDKENESGYHSINSRDANYWMNSNN